MKFNRKQLVTPNQVGKGGNRILIKIDETAPERRALRESYVSDVKGFMDRFNAAREAVGETKQRQMVVVQQIRDMFEVTRMNIRGYHSTLNLKIRTGLTPAADRRFFQIAAEDQRVPEIWSMDDLLQVGYRVWKGEQKRRTIGSAHVLDPNPFEVGQQVQAFEGLVRLRTRYTDQYEDARKEVETLRKEGVKLLRTVYSIIWMYFADQGHTSESNRRECREYGMIFLNKENGEILEDDQVVIDEEPDQTDGDEPEEEPVQPNLKPQMQTDENLDDPLFGSGDVSGIPLIQVDEFGNPAPPYEGGETTG